MNTTSLNITGNDLLHVIGGGGLPALEMVAASSDTAPPLKEAVMEALAIIGIVTVCVLTLIILSRLSMRWYQKFKINKKDWAAFSVSLINKIKEVVQATCQYNESQVLSLTLKSNFENLKGYTVLILFFGYCLDSSYALVFWTI